jgi:hypothetical protein
MIRRWFGARFGSALKRHKGPVVTQILLTETDVDITTETDIDILT